MLYWPSYSPRLTRRVLTLKMCGIREVGVSIPETTCRSYKTHVFVAFYCSPFERCSVCFKRNISVIAHKFEFTVPPLTRSKPFSGVDNSRSTLPLLSFQFLAELRIPFFLDIPTLEVEVTVLPRNVGNGLYIDAASYPRRTEFSANSYTKISKLSEFFYVARSALSHLPQRLQQQ
jgi:hypothetical protein